MLNYYIWDKKSNINNASAEHILSVDAKRRYEDVVVLTNNDIPCQIQCASELSNMCEFKGTTDEVVRAYIEFRNKEEMQQEKEQLNIEDAHNKISILTEKLESVTVKNTTLQESQKTQDTEIISGMLANAELFEMVLAISSPATINNKTNGGKGMIEVYATLIIKGVKKLEDVPMVIREQVRLRLVELGIPGYEIV